MSSRSITDLHPQFQPLASQFLTVAKQRGFDVLLYCTYRSLPEQAALYAQGRTAPGAIVTDAPAGSSAHNYGLAFDACPMNNGKPVWSDVDPLWATYGALALACGLDWAGAAGFPFREFPHCQMPNWRAFTNNPITVTA